MNDGVDYVGDFVADDELDILRMEVGLLWQQVHRP